MLIEVKKLHGLTIHALDGEIGSVEELLFDDTQWTLRYLIANTGNWLANHKVLISPMALGHLDWEQRTLNVNLTREQLQKSPEVDQGQPVSRQWEKAYFDYYAWPYYWNGVGSWGGYWYPGVMLRDTQPETHLAQDEPHTQEDSHLRSTKEVTGYSLSATDGHLGHITDFLVNDETWRICYLAIDTQNWWPGKQVLLPPEWATHISWIERSVSVKVTREQVKGAPAWSTGQPIPLDFEQRLYDYYARQRPIDPPKQQERAETMLTRQESTFIGIYDTREEAEAAIRDLQKLGIDMAKLSILGKDYHGDEEIVGYYAVGDRMRAWGTTGAFWGGIWSLLLGSGFFLVPGVGPLLAAGPIVTWIIAALDGATVVGGMSVLGVALMSIGIPKDRILVYERHIRSGKFIVIAHDAGSTLDKAMVGREANRQRELAPV